MIEVSILALKVLAVTAFAVTVLAVPVLAVVIKVLTVITLGVIRSPVTGTFHNHMASFDDYGPLHHGAALGAAALAGRVSASSGT